MSVRGAARTGAGLLAAVALTLALGGCLKLDLAMTVSADDTVDGTMIIALDKSLATATGQTEERLREQLAENAPTAAPGTTVEPYDDGTYLGNKITFADVSLSELNKESDSAQSLRIVHDTQAGTYTATGELDLSELRATEPVGAAFARTLDVKVAVTLPGTVIEHNGALDGTTVTWVGKAGEKLTMRAVSEEASAVAWVPVLAIGIPTLLVIAGLVWWLVSRRRSAAAPEPADAHAGLGPPSDPWSTTTPNLEAQQRPEADGQAGTTHH
jgi:hypothetical protein